MELLYQIGLTLIDGVGPKLGRALYEHCGSAEAVFKEKKKNLLRIPDIGALTVNRIFNKDILKQAEDELRFADKQKINVLFYKNDLFPRRLLHCSDSPLLLYYKGCADLNCEKIISIVGTRRSTDYGKQITSQLIQDLQADKPLIISGLAYGIDTHAHQSALHNQLATIGVLGHGLDRIYPSSNKSLALKMLENGGLLTEFRSYTNPDAVNFPSRNRIIAGLSDATIVIEAAESGGALITAEIANTYNRDVFAVPGRIQDTYSKGCNKLIKTNKAALIQNAEDIRYILNWSKTPKSKQQIQRQLFIELPEGQKEVFEELNKQEKLFIDELCSRCKQPLSQMSNLLLELELSGLIETLPGKCYRVII